MGVKITIKEELLYSDNSISQLLTINQSTVTVLDVLEAKVREAIECAESNNGLSDQEREAHIHETLKILQTAFKKNGFVVLFDDRQMESLEEKVQLTDETIITLLKLVPLVGG